MSQVLALTTGLWWATI